MPHASLSVTRQLPKMIARLKKKKKKKIYNHFSDPSFTFHTLIHFTHTLSNDLHTLLVCLHTLPEKFTQPYKNLHDPRITGSPLFSCLGWSQEPCSGSGLENKNEHNLVNFRATSSRFCMQVDLDRPQPSL